MDPSIINALTGTLAVLIGGLVVLVPILALTVRFALRPLVETWIKSRELADGGVERRLAILELELQQIRASQEALLEAQDFQRRLSEPRHGVRELLES